MRKYHENTFFYTVACLVAVIAYQDAFVVALVYLGLIAKFAQLAGLLVSNERMCQIAHGAAVMCNIVVLVINIINFGTD